MEWDEPTLTNINAKLTDIMETLSSLTVRVMRVEDLLGIDPPTETATNRTQRGQGTPARRRRMRHDEMVARVNELKEVGRSGVDSHEGLGLHEREARGVRAERDGA